MGTILQTCGVSHLPIKEGDEVVLILLAKNRHAAPKFFLRHYNEEYGPICLPIFGKYNGYNGIEDVSISDCAERILKNWTYEDEECNRYSFTGVEELIEKVNFPGLYISFKDKNSTINKIECAFYHKSLYTKLVKLMAGQVPYGKTETYSELIHKSYSEFEERYSETKQQQPGMMWIMEKFYRNMYQSSIGGVSLTMAAYNLFVLSKLKEFHKELIDYRLFTLALETGGYGFNSASRIPGEEICTIVQRNVAEFILDFTKEWEATLHMTTNYF